MTDRTFRSPSPNSPSNRPVNRPASSHGPYPQYDQDEAPPVPALPKDIAQRFSARPASVEPRQRTNSPPPRQNGGRVVSLDRGPGTLPDRANSVKTKRMQAAIKEQPPSPRGTTSINFSRPMSPQALSYPAVSDEGAADIARSLSQTADRPVKKKKKKITPNVPAEGSFLAAANSDGPHGTAVEALTAQKPAASPTSQDARTSQLPFQVDSAKKKKKKMAHSSPVTHADSTSELYSIGYPSDTDSVTSERSSSGGRAGGAAARARGSLAKQPSIVREDREAEELAEGKPKATRKEPALVSNGAAVPSTPANTSKVLSKDRQQNRTSSQQTTPTVPENTQIDRPVSLTPGRAAHFSSHPEYATLDATRHQPLGRSASPAKSALKHSPSRGHSPVVNRSGLAPSEASDTASQVSDDGPRSTSTSKKRRNVRVSFDEESVFIGHAAGPSSATDSPVILSPQGKAKPQSWFDLLRDKKKEDPGSDQDEDSVMKPTPALPSFGSIRERQKPSREATDQPVISEKVTGPNLQSTSMSSDASIGNVIAGESTKREVSDSSTTPKPSSNDPIPPEVTSVEGTGEHSEDDELDDLGNSSERRPEDQPQSQKAQDATLVVDETENPTIKDVTTSSHETALKDENGSVPIISVQPASPNPGTPLKNRSSWLGMPGGFPSANDGDDNKDASVPSQHAESSESVPTPHLTNTKPVSDGAAAREISNSPVEVAPLEQSSGPKHLEDVEETEETDETDENSIYSDAAEDQSDLEGDGFGSINAIVESPTSPATAPPSKSPPASPSLKAPKEKSVRPAPTSRQESGASVSSGDGWVKTQSYWASLSQAQRQQLEHAALPGAVDEPVLRNRTMRGKDAVPKKKKKAKDLIQQTDNKAPTEGAPAQVQAVKTSPSQPRNGPSKQTSPSLRSEPPLSRAPNRSSLPPSSTVPSVEKKGRPVSELSKTIIQPVPKSGQATAQTSSAGGRMVAPPTATKKMQKKKAANAVPKLSRGDSDSSSSFKKTRARSPADSQYKMKRTMRATANDKPQGPNSIRASSLSLRSTSPMGPTTRRPFSAMGSSSMRTSMRDSSDLGRPLRSSLRAPESSSKASRTKSPSRFGFGKAAKATPTESKSASRFSSRFGDSSDDEDGFPTAVSSRFADSSDEDEPTKLTPVRGIPRRIDEGDSTDLEDSSGDETRGQKSSTAVETPNTQMSSPEGQALATGSLRSASGAQAPVAGLGAGFQAKKAAEKEKKRRSFLGGFGGKKRETVSQVRKDEIGKPSPFSLTLEQRRGDRTSGIPSITAPQKAPLSLLKPVAEAPLSINTNLNNSAPSSAAGTMQNSPKHPKLQRKQTPKKLTTAKDISWPLSPPPQGVASEPEARPRTSDGGNPGNDSGRPAIGLRQNTAQSEAALGPGKKKKVSFWRKAFGLGN